MLGAGKMPALQLRTCTRGHTPSWSRPVGNSPKTYDPVHPPWKRSPLASARGPSGAAGTPRGSKLACPPAFPATCFKLFVCHIPCGCQEVSYFFLGSTPDIVHA